MALALSEKVVHFWYKKSILAYVLLPLSWIFQGIATLRRFVYRYFAKPLPVPVIIVGNLTVGGTGKSPVVAWLVQYLLNQGWQPGVLMRGYKGKLHTHAVKAVVANSDPNIVGDEAVVLANNINVPIVVGKSRRQAAQYLLQRYPQVNILISDDGLQHYRLARDIEIVVVDGIRQFGNGLCLPAGPLRESMHRLSSVDFVITNGGKGAIMLQLQLSAMVMAVNSPETRPLNDFVGKTVHAVAGIGHPQRFFAMLTALGIHIKEHPFSDHHRFTENDLKFNDDYPILMTQKDAVKCTDIRIKAYYVKLETHLPPEFGQQLLEKLARGQKITGHSRLPHL